MNQKRWLQMLQYTDDKYVEEADPGKVRKKSRWTGLLAACLCCVLIAGSFVLFMPYQNQLPDTSQFRESDYYELIQVLSRMNYREPEYSNNYEYLYGELIRGQGKLEYAIEDSLMADGAIVPETNAAAEVPAEGEPADDQQYQEITDNQVAGVTEADRIKRTDQYIYYLDGDTLRAYTIAGDATENVGIFRFSDALKTGGLSDQWEFYLSQDGTRINVIAPCLDENNQRQLKVLCLDVSDPKNISIINTFGISGQNISSRVTGDSLLLMTKYRASAQEMDFSDETTFLPQITCDGQVSSIPSDKIVIPQSPVNSSYLVILKLNMETLQMQDCLALLSFSENLYVSQNRIYASNQYTGGVRQGENGCSYIMTQIVGIDYTGDSFGTSDSIEKCSVNVEGYLKDQYSMDEHEGILRVVTTTRKTEQVVYDGTRDTLTGIISASNKTSANLYCVDLESWDVTGKVEQFAPEGETVRSVRFDGTSAYVCTAVELTDPVFFFDLSDVKNITYKDTGNIEGYSSSLVNFGNGYLLGIGMGSSWGELKVEVYAESANAVESVCSFETAVGYYPESYKSYYIDRQNQLVGLGYTDINGNSRYMVLLFDGYELNKLVDTELAGVPELMRGVYIADWFYLFGREEFKTEKLF